MKFKERSYGGKLFIPRPEVTLDETRNLAVVSTTWGSTEGAKSGLERFFEFIELASDDQDITTPFDRWENLSANANNLRIATLVSNDHVFRNINSEEYVTGFELAAVQHTKTEICVLTVGSFIPLFIRDGQAPLPLVYQLSLASDFSEHTPLPPLPSSLVGVSNHLSVTTQSFRKMPGDKILLINRNHLTSNIFEMWEEGANLDRICNIFAQENQELPFWLGLIEID